ncbi:NHL domain-containing thioredoxin family protein [Dermabacteraceae bacterium P13138]
MTEYTTGPRIRASRLQGRGWLNTGGQELSLESLRGKIVLLDFWTFCCVNCLHVLDELRPLEEKWREELVVIGVHSPKFVHEADAEALAANVSRYEIHHPVLDDPELRTWTSYGVRAWPSLVLIDPEGYIVSAMSGEGHGENLDAMIADLVAEHDKKGTLVRGEGPTVLPDEAPSALRFPSKIAPLPDGRLLVSDAGHHRLVVFGPDHVTIEEVIGTGQRGLADGVAAEAQFAEPNGIAVLAPEVAEQVGYDVIVADTANHLLRGIALGHDRFLRARTESTVTTLAGTGKQWMHGDALPDAESDARTINLSTPWDVVVGTALDGEVVIAMAGIHQIWGYQPLTGALRVIAGTRNEGLVDGPLATSWWAQTSGLDVDSAGYIWCADSETSALRRIDPYTGTVQTVVGTGLFDFGHVDGPADQARFQHPLGVVTLEGGVVAVCDTYNGAIRVVSSDDEGNVTVETIATDLAEPSDATPVFSADGWPELLVVESAAHRLTNVSLAPAARRTIGGQGQRTQRPVTEVAADLTVAVQFTPPKGHKLDESMGPSTQVHVSATPPELLLEGEGTDVELIRAIKLNPEVGEGVLHVAARAASCDADESVEFPACHMHQQDWGVPVKVSADGDGRLNLPLLGS